jgi:hypothetical protein
MSADDALAFVKTKRRIVNPNEGFMEQLRAYEKALRSRITIKFDFGLPTRFPSTPSQSESLSVNQCIHIDTGDEKQCTTSPAHSAMTFDAHHNQNAEIEANMIVHEFANHQNNISGLCSGYESDSESSEEEEDVFVPSLFVSFHITELHHHHHKHHPSFNAKLDQVRKEHSVKLEQDSIRHMKRFWMERPTLIKVRIEVNFPIPFDFASAPHSVQESSEPSNESTKLPIDASGRDFDELLQIKLFIDIEAPPIPKPLIELLEKQNSGHVDGEITKSSSNLPEPLLGTSQTQ